MTSYEVGKLAEMANLEADWDSYGSVPIAKIALDIAASILAIAPQEATDIGPLCNGGIDLEWEKDGNELLLEIWPNGAVTWVTTIGGHSDCGRYVSRIEQLLDSMEKP